MRAVVIVCLLGTLGLSACQGAQATETPAPLPPNSTALPPTEAGEAAPVAPTHFQQPAAPPDLAIYLVAGDLTPADLLAESTDGDATALPVDKIPLQSEPLLTLADIVAYDAATHAFTLTTTATERLAALNIRVSGLAFVLTVAGEPVYAGAFWTPLSSLSYDGVVIMLMPDGTPAFGPYRIELGYPGPDFFQGADPRGDPRILDALVQAGKLAP
ncbi:MAG: hypothetical protein JXC32_14270 [Anaerolineae bacterium]|nr:hypothetical protein [Anaerolineae bacterium]